MSSFDVVVMMHGIKFFERKLDEFVITYSGGFYHIDDKDENERLSFNSNKFTLEGDGVFVDGRKIELAECVEYAKSSR